MVTIFPPQNILFLDTNICIKIYQAVSKNISYMDMDDTLKIFKDKNRPNTIIFVFPYLLEGGFRNVEHDSENNMDKTLNDAECIKKFFDKSICDIENLKRLKEERKSLELAN